MQYDSAPTVVNGRTMVPIRHTLEAFGATVQWNSNTKWTTITKGSDTVQIRTNDTTAYRNGVAFTLETAPFSKNNRSYVPLRFIAETFGYRVEWNSTSRSVFITEPLQPIAVPVLMYHHIAENGASGSIISPARFREHMQMIHAEGYTTITDNQLYENLKNGAPLPLKPILITFDDGYQSNFTYAYPTLKELGMKASIHLITSRVTDGTPSYTNEIPKMSWAEAQQSGDVFSFQGHTEDSHFKGVTANGTTRGVITGRIIKADGQLETQAEFEERLLRDLTVSKQTIEERLGQQVITLAYPFGDYSADTIRIAQKAGYKMAFTVKQGKVESTTADLFRLNRITGNGQLTADQLRQVINQY
ncbi:hypothetical protein B0X71_13735 [Planococcus lenghuensis]|uniref:NodB homology domain-containing protein n=1 Tax=Planococcus lenghuensis TaxID=2213202 RepID=A0A1Q2L3X6_9BACL|nr:hypothetical protein B0X71_13735 [Planococcus lenghuensis]